MGHSDRSVVATFQHDWRVAATLRFGHSLKISFGTGSVVACNRAHRFSDHFVMTSHAYWRTSIVSMLR